MFVLLNLINSKLGKIVEIFMKNFYPFASQGGSVGQITSEIYLVNVTNHSI